MVAHLSLHLPTVRGHGLGVAGGCSALTVDSHSVLQMRKRRMTYLTLRTCWKATSCLWTRRTRAWCR